MGKKNKKAWIAVPLSIVWTIWHERTYIAFENKDFLAQRMKTSFICNLWYWSNVYIVERSRSLVGFLTWLGCSCVGWYSLLWAGGFLFCLSFFPSFIPWWDPLVYHYRPVGHFGCSFVEYICFYSSKKKKKIYIST